VSEFVPTVEEAALYDWVALAVTGLDPLPVVLFADQGKPYPNYPYVTLKVLQETSMTANPDTKVLDEELSNGNFREQTITPYRGTLSLQAFGPTHATIARRIEASLNWASVQELNRNNNIGVGYAENGRLNLSTMLPGVPEPRSGIDFQYHFTECIDSPEGVGVIESVIATGVIDTVTIVASEP
jgi:hypothetical protein